MIERPAHVPEAAWLRFWSKVEAVESGCMEWQAHRQPSGYGFFWWGGRMRIASRVLAEWLFGPLTPDQQACHSCDNPPCVNPLHLFVGTGEDNKRDSLAKGRHARCERIWTAKLRADDVRSVIRRFYAGESIGDLASAYGVALPTICRILDGSGWQDITGDLTSPEKLVGELRSRSRSGCVRGRPRRMHVSEPAVHQEIAP